MGASVSKESNFPMPNAPRNPADAALVTAAARLAGWDPGPGRLAELVPAMSGFYSLLDLLHRDELGDTPPATAFQAQWDGR